MKNKIKKQRCFQGNHDNKNLSDYHFSHTDVRWKYPVDIYVCNKCQEALDRAIDREERISKNIEKQQQESAKRFYEKLHKEIAEAKISMVENMWDNFIKDELSKGLKLKGHDKYLYKEKIPKELLQLTRATMKLQRKVKAIKSVKREEVKQEKEKIEKLNKPLMNCRYHGSLFPQDIIKGGFSRWTKEQRYKCKECMRDLHKDYYSRKKEYVLKKCAEYRANFPEKRKEIKAKSWRKHHGKHNEHEDASGKSSTSV